MFTRCPECETTFRLSAADLRRAQGRVRCGDCETVFNALEFLAEEPAESARQSRHLARPDFAGPTRLTNPANPERTDDGRFDRDDLDASGSTAESRNTEARHADDSGNEPQASGLAEAADQALPSADSDDEYASDEQDGYQFDDDYGDEDDEYSSSGILVTDADFELPGDWHDRSIVDYTAAREASVKAWPANEIWPDEPTGDDEEDAPGPADASGTIAAESDADSGESRSAFASQNSEAGAEEQTTQEPVLFAPPGYPEDEAPEGVVGDDGLNEAGERGPGGQVFLEAGEVAGSDDIDPGSLTRQLKTALDAGAELSPVDAANLAATPDPAAPETSATAAARATDGFAESAETDTDTDIEATAEHRIVSFVEVEQARNGLADAPPTGDADPLRDLLAAQADSTDDEAEFESFEIWGTDATAPDEDEYAGPETPEVRGTQIPEPYADDDEGFESLDIDAADAAKPAAEEAADPGSDSPSEPAGDQYVVADADELDDSVWERIPGVGSNEPVAAVIEDSLFARTGAGWDISRALAGPATELDQPDEEAPGNIGGPVLDAYARQDEGDDDADEVTGDDDTDVRLTGEPGYSESEGWQDEPDPDLPGFRDEFEPIEATRADLLEFNAPEDTWSSIFAPAELEDTSEDWLDDEEDEDPDTDWPALGSETEDDDVARGMPSLPGEEEDSSGLWARHHDSGHFGADWSEDDPLAEATGAPPGDAIGLPDANAPQQDSDDSEDEDEAGAGTEPDPHLLDTELPEGFAADDYEVQHVVLEDPNDVAGLTQAFEKTPHGLSEAPPWNAEKYEADAETPSRKGLWLLGSFVLIAALATQLIHYNRDELAAHPTWGNEVRRAYAALGMDVYPAWSVRSYEIRGSEAVAGESGADLMDIRAQIASIDNNPTGLPYLRVVLRDRWSNPIAAQHFSPTEYAAADQLPADGIMQPNQTLAAHVSIEDPGAGAQGFELELCLPRRDTGLECTGQPFK